MAKRFTGGNAGGGKSVALTGEVINVQPENPETALIANEGGILTAMLQGIGRFMGQANELEAQARTMLADAKALRATPPQNGEDDQRVQAFVRRAKDQKKTVEEHWTLTAKVSAFHKKLTAKRNIAVEALEEAERIGNDLHAKYKADAERKAREEQDRLRREAEEKARLDRERELAELEAQRLAAEATSDGLSEREQVFVDAYYRNGELGTSAARAAGYKDADKQAQRLLATPKIIAALEGKRQADQLRKQAEAKKEAPILVADVPEVRADVSKGGDRVTWSATITDVDAFLTALLDPMTRTKHGMPVDIIIDTMKQVIKANDNRLPALNRYATQLHEQIGRWPGVAANKKTAVL